MRQAILVEMKRAREERKSVAVEEQAAARRSFEDAQQRFNKTSDEMSSCSFSSLHSLSCH